MAEDSKDWQAPDVTPLTVEDGATERPTAKSRNAVISDV
jgi:hypothetical protein